MPDARSRLPGTPEPSHWALGASGVPLAYDCWGPSTGRPIFLLHGSGQTRHSWKGAGKQLAASGFRVIAPDTRGHGDSGWAPNGDYSPDAEIEDLQVLTALCGNPRPILVGASRGGATCLLAVGEGKVQAAGIALVDIAAHIEVDGADRVRAFMQQAPDGFRTLAEVSQAIGNYLPDRKRPRSLHGLAKNVRIGEDGRYYWHWDPKALLGTEVLHIRRRRMEEASKRLHVPTLLVRGAASDVLSEEGVRRFVVDCPHAEVARIVGARHMVAGDRNDPFAAVIVDFAVRVDGR